MTSPLKADKKAQSLVPQIFKAHEELVEAETSGFNQSLKLAIELGLLLKLAKEAVYHGHWETWFNDQKFKFSYRSANRYMRLAKDREKLEDERNSPRVANLAAEGELSIRAAERLLRPEGDSGSSSDNASSRSSKASPDLATLMKNCGADEIKTAMKQAEKYDEVMTTPLADQIKITPLTVLVKILTEAYEPGRLQDLIKDLTNRLKSKSIDVAPIRRTFTDQPATATQ
jgi:Protein of unknown function (DUF3102)